MVEYETSLIYQKFGSCDESISNSCTIAAILSTSILHTVKYLSVELPILFGVRIL